jgi:hypothetical protein
VLRLTFRVICIVDFSGGLFFDVLSGLCSLTFGMDRFVDVSGGSCC